jgi:hypothetical protein
VKAAWNSGMPDFSRSKHTKTEKIYQVTINYAKKAVNYTNGRKIFQMVIKYNNIFCFFKALQILPNLGFLLFWFKNKPSGNPGFKSVTLERLLPELSKVFSTIKYYTRFW